MMPDEPRADARRTTGEVELNQDELVLVREALNCLHQRTFDPDKDLRIRALWDRLGRLV